MKIPLDKITLGITDDEVLLGSHLIHFWQLSELAGCAFYLGSIVKSRNECGVTLPQKG